MHHAELHALLQKGCNIERPTNGCPCQFGIVQKDPKGSNHVEEEPVLQWFLLCSMQHVVADAS